jgi:hypothetical protein
MEVRTRTVPAVAAGEDPLSGNDLLSGLDVEGGAVAVRPLRTFGVSDGGAESAAATVPLAVAVAGFGADAGDGAATGLSPRTVRLSHTVVRQSLEQARRWGLIARNPAVDASPPPQKHAEVTPPSVAQVRALIDAAGEDDPDFAAYLWVLAATGCRRGEGCALGVRRSSRQPTPPRR